MVKKIEKNKTGHYKNFLQTDQQSKDLASNSDLNQTIHSLYFFFTFSFSLTNFSFSCIYIRYNLAQLIYYLRKLQWHHFFVSYVFPFTNFSPKYIFIKFLFLMKNKKEGSNPSTKKIIPFFTSTYSEIIYSYTNLNTH